MGRAPIIIAGMHRSGTSVVTRGLAHFGLFVGDRLDPNHESFFFKGYNEWLLRSAGGRWDTPTAIDYLLADAGVAERARAVEVLRRRVSSRACAEFLGGRRWLAVGSLQKMRRPWAWKDPRNTLTLPFWLEVFPDARVLMVVRDGVAVADSLRRRAQGAFDRGIPDYRWQHTPTVASVQDVLGESPRVRSLEQGFVLWEEYVERGAAHAAELGDRVRVVRYEDLLAQPEETFADLARFCELRLGSKQLRTVVSGLRPERVGGFLADAEVAEFHRQVRGSRWMTHHGYAAEAGPTPAP